MKILSAFFQRTRNRRLIYLLILLLFTSVNLFITPKKRYIFGFYSQKSRSLILENRFLIAGETKEDQLRHYVEEYLLGPMMIDSYPLFSQESSLNTIMIRKDHAYIDLTDLAALPAAGPIPFKERARVFTDMVQKNFQSLKEITLFIAGNELYHTNTVQKIKKSVDK